MRTIGQPLTHRKRMDLESDIMHTVSRMKMQPMVIMLSNKKLCEIDEDMLSRLQIGTRYTASDWSKILDLLVTPKAPEANVYVKELGTLSAVRYGKTFFWIRSVGQSPYAYIATWCITSYKPAENTVSTYSIGPMTADCRELSAITNVIGVEKYLLRYMYQQETCSDTVFNQPYQDTVLLDMLLDLTADDFTPNQRHIDDGLAFQLEVLEALEKAQKNAADANATARDPTTQPPHATAVPSKKRVSMEDRLKNKKVKVEL